ncbi:MAG: exodeoxyribonuclease VII small subunit [Planctomycetota bacterium]|nr:exodeoxyribonuclease VII small subunit [Planctomycetota bacterium]
MAKRKPTAKSFDEQLGALEEIVEQLESGELTLEESIAGYKGGVAALKELHKSMVVAEQEVKELSVDLRSEINELESGYDD